MTAVMVRWWWQAAAMDRSRRGRGRDRRRSRMGSSLDELDFSGEDVLPDLLAFVETHVDTFAPAFRRQAASGLLP
jgi:hypothetical protein